MLYQTPLFLVQIPLIPDSEFLTLPMKNFCFYTSSSFDLKYLAQLSLYHVQNPPQFWRFILAWKNNMFNSNFLRAQLLSWSVSSMTELKDFTLLSRGDNCLISPTTNSTLTVLLPFAFCCILHFHLMLKTFPKHNAEGRVFILILPWLFLTSIRRLPFFYLECFQHKQFSKNAFMNACNMYRDFQVPNKNQVP